MSIGYGTKARVGQLYPSGGLTEFELQLMAPEGVQVVTTRMPFAGTSIDDDLGLANGLEGHSRLLLDAGVDAIAFNCTAASMLLGPDTIRDRIRAVTEVPVVTTIDGVESALRACASRRIALVTAYGAEVNEAEIEHFEARGLKVQVCTGIPCTSPQQQAAIDPGRWLQVAVNLPARGVDTVVLSCGGIRVASVLEQIESTLGVPVISSNQALLWQLLRTIGLPDRPLGHGRLLEGCYD